MVLENFNDLKNIKILIAYEGTNYSGWQRQNNKKTIQGTIENAIAKITCESSIKLNGSGRTDAGVHAIGQVGNFITKSKMPVDKWPLVLNNKLPKDIRVNHAEEVSDNFHSRYSAKSKIYCYVIMNKTNDSKISLTKKLFLGNYCIFIDKNLDILRMKQAAKYLVGNHDFSALSCINQRGNQKNKNRTRELKRIEIKVKGPFIYFLFEANSFLYKMVRIIVGTLIEFSIKKRSPEDIIEIMNKKDSQESGIVMPPSGLYLIKVKYN